MLCTHAQTFVLPYHSKQVSVSLPLFFQAISFKPVQYQLLKLHVNNTICYVLKWLGQKRVQINAISTFLLSDF